MQKSLILGALLAFALYVSAQVTTRPYILQKGYEGAVTIVYNPNEGNGGMKEATKCYAHTGYNDWKGTGSWRDGKAKYEMTKDTDGNWRLEMPNGLYAYYGITTTTDVQRLCFVFNDGPGGQLEGKSADGGDIFVYLAEAGLNVQFVNPSASTRIEAGTVVDLFAVTSETANLSLKVNEQEVATVSSAT